MMNRRLLICYLIVFLAALVVVFSQQTTTLSASIETTRLTQTFPGPSPSPASSDDVVRITTNLVQVDVVVTRDGKKVTDLKSEDFEIFEDGKRQTITNFAYVSTSGRGAHTGSSSSKTTTPLSEPPEGPVPNRSIDPKQVGRTIAFVVDDLGMSFESMARVKRQLATLIAKKLGPADLLAVIRTGGDVGALQQFTTNRDVLRTAVANLKWNQCSRVGLAVLPPVRLQGYDDRPLCQRGITDTIRALRFILRGMAALPGRKSMIVISDSLPTEHQPVSIEDPNLERVGEGQKAKLNTARPISDLDGLNRLAEIAIRSSVVIYAVASQGLPTVGPHAADAISYPPLGTPTRPDQDVITRLILDRSSRLRRSVEGANMLANQTGGFLISNTNEFEFEKVLEDQSGYYLIGYRPDSATFDRRFHQIRAKVKRDGVTVRTRAGFYGVTETDAPMQRLTIRDRRDLALASPFGANEIDVRATPIFSDDPAHGSILHVFLTIDANDLTFSEQPDGNQNTNLEISVILFGENGAIASRHDHPAALRLSREAFERVKRNDLVYSFQFPAKNSGDFQLRVAVLDIASSRVGAAGQFITIPDLDNKKLALSGIVIQQDTSTTDASTPNGTYMLNPEGMGRFPQGSRLLFGYTIYNAKLDAGRLPQLISQITIFREGKRVYSFDRTSVNVSGQADPKRITVGARLDLGPGLMPGEYVLQIVVEDQASKQTATQWTQFEVVN